MEPTENEVLITNGTVTGITSKTVWAKVLAAQNDGRIFEFVVVMDRDSGLPSDYIRAIAAPAAPQWSEKT